MRLKLIENDKEHETALARIAKLMDAEPGSRRMEELDLLAHLAETYEERRWPIRASSAAEAIRFRLDQLGLRATDLGRLLGSRGRASELLSGKRTPSVGMMRKLVEQLAIPIESLFGMAPCPAPAPFQATSHVPEATPATTRIDRTLAAANSRIAYLVTRAKSGSLTAPATSATYIRLADALALGGSAPGSTSNRLLFAAAKPKRKRAARAQEAK